MDNCSFESANEKKQYQKERIVDEDKYFWAVSINLLNGWYVLKTKTQQMGHMVMMAGMAVYF
jgi:hypothetical protein